MDGESEFGGVFAPACGRLPVYQTRTKSRHAYTDGFVERLQRTIQHEHWRMEFLCRDDTSRSQLQSAPQDSLRFYKKWRP
ncbi:MAG: hypothetical protein ACE5FA_13615 [Dehalococcoidia bacterium]